MAVFLASEDSRCVFLTAHYADPGVQRLTRTSYMLASYITSEVIHVNGG